jgi:hypothetical protein
LLSDPLSVTYDGTSKSLPRTSTTPNRTVYRTGDAEFEVTVSNSVARDGTQRIDVNLSRTAPDPTPNDAFDAFRKITNSFGISIKFDSTRANLSDDLPKLRTALLAFVDSTLQSRLIGGEK